MLDYLVFHSGNPNWMSCKKAIGVANEMKETFCEKIQVNIHTTDSEQAQEYNFRSSTNVLVNKEFVALDISTDKNKMKSFLEKKIKD